MNHRRLWQLLLALLIVAAIVYVACDRPLHCTDQEVETGMCGDKR